MLLLYVDKRKILDSVISLFKEIHLSINSSYLWMSIYLHFSNSPISLKTVITFIITRHCLHKNVKTKKERRYPCENNAKTTKKFHSAQVDFSSRWKYTIFSLSGKAQTSLPIIKSWFAFTGQAAFLILAQLHDSSKVMQNMTSILHPN